MALLACLLLAGFGGVRAALADVLLDELPDAEYHRSSHHDQGTTRGATDGRIPRQAVLP
jgi:hypothetical protein